MTTKVTTRAEFECCYIFDSILNAHRYRIEITVDGPQRQEDLGSVIEFSKLKKYVMTVVPNNTFIFDATCENAGRDVAFTMGKHGIKIMAVSFVLSAENICNYIVSTLQQILDLNEPGVKITNAKLRENNDSYVSWDASPAVSE